MIEYHTLNDLIELSAEKELEVWEIIQQADMYENDRTESDSFNMMRDIIRLISFKRIEVL